MLSGLLVVSALRLVETAARVDSHAVSLVDSGVVEALDTACLSDVVFVGNSISAGAAGAVVALVGKNEGGKTLSRATVNAVVEGLAIFFDPTHVYGTGQQILKVLPSARRIATMAIADANKKIMLQHDKLLDILIAGLLLDGENEWQGQDGADVMQDTCAATLHELALYAPGAAVLKRHGRTMEALRVLAEVGTKESRERAASALFELDREARSQEVEARFILLRPSSFLPFRRKR